MTLLLDRDEAEFFDHLHSLEAQHLDEPELCTGCLQETAGEYPVAIGEDVWHRECLRADVESGALPLAGLLEHGEELAIAEVCVPEHETRTLVQIVDYLRAEAARAQVLGGGISAHLRKMADQIAGGGA